MADFNGAKQQADGDLTWLARNVHEWPIFAKYISKCHDSYSWTADFLSEHGSEWHSKEDWLTRRAELQVKQGPSSDDWHKRGELPPVGVECEIRHRNWARDKWECVLIVALTEEYAIVKYSRCEQHYSLADMTFRPLQTERERVASELVDVMMAVPVSDRKTASESYMSMALAIYDHLHQESKS